MGYLGIHKNICLLSYYCFSWGGGNLPLSSLPAIIPAREGSLSTLRYLGIHKNINKVFGCISLTYTIDEMGVQSQDILQIIADKVIKMTFLQKTNMF